MSTAAETRIKCQICGAMIHSVEHHLSEDHPATSLADYQAKFPGAPIMSDVMIKKLAERRAGKTIAPVAAAAAPAGIPAHHMRKPLHEVFGLEKPVLTASKKPVMVTVFDRSKLDPIDAAMIPEVDENYVFNIDVLRILILGLERNIPTFLWGHAGTGKTTILEQICARTGRPALRVQHTANMEESHVLGLYVLRGKEMHFEPGPLMMAMQRGWVYIADEYDFGRPEVLSVYQPVLELKPLVTKEADLANRVTKPHGDFRIVATGNTNGTGDETGLYQGTNVQNAANFERFGITERMPYMEPEMEAKVVARQGGIPEADASNLVDFAGRIRAEYDGGKIGSPISPRTLIYAAMVGKARGSFRAGIERAFMNRLSTVDFETAKQLANRVFAS